MLEIVDATTDTAAAARIVTEMSRWWTMTPESIEHDRAVLPTYRDWLALRDGRPVAAASCVELPDMKESTAAFGGAWVLEEARREGIGTMLLDRVRAHARSLGKTDLEAFVFADNDDGRRYLEGRGFVIVMHLRGLRLVLERCPVPAVRLPAGITLTTLAERRDLAEAVWDTACEVLPDIPYDGDVPLHPGTLEEFTAWDLSGPNQIPEATFVAIEDGNVIGYGQLVWNDRAKGIAVHEMLAVRRAYRGRGIATGLKAAQIAWAKENGLTEIRTGNEERNLAARAVNAKFPFEPIPDGLLFRGPIDA